MVVGVDRELPGLAWAGTLARSEPGPSATMVGDGSIANLPIEKIGTAVVKRVSQRAEEARPERSTRWYRARA